MGLKVEILPVLSDNYIFMLTDETSNKTVAIDPSEAGPVLDYLKSTGNELDFIWNTHHHWDHTDGNLGLKQATGCKIYGSSKDQHRIPGIDERLSDGDRVSLGAYSAEVLLTPGHTSGHIQFWFESELKLFPGDTLFPMGCGRLFEGDAGDMFGNFERIRKLPSDTKIFSAHEYSENNAKFALTLEPGNSELKERLHEIEKTREDGRPTVPFSLGSELATSPFFRCSSPEIRKNLDLTAEASEREVFAEIRKRRNSW